MDKKTDKETVESQNPWKIFKFKIINFWRVKLIKKVSTGYKTKKVLNYIK